MTEGPSTRGAELPPAPAARCISPATEDYATRPALLPLLWPLAWLGAFVLLGFLLSSEGWHDVGGHAAPGHAADEAGPTEAPGHSGTR